MKKMLFVLLPVLILTVSCGNKGKFSLNGTLQDTVFNGKTIYLTDYIDREYIPFDSAVVKDGKFSISTVCDSSRVVFLTVALLPGADPIVLPVVMEKGKAQVEIGNTSFVLNGTPQNIILQQFAETETQIAKQLDDYKMQLDADTTMADSTRTILYNQMDELTTQQYADMAFDKAKQNVNTAVGTYIFQNSYYYFKPQKIDEILTLTDEQIKKTPKMQKIIASNELEKTLQPGSKYVDFKSLMPAGDTLLLSNLIGQKEYLLLDFWASWCSYCVAEFPEMKQMYAQNIGRLEILGISLDSERQKWIEGGIQKFALPWQQVSNLQGWEDEIAKKYAVASIPAYYLIDREGKIVATKATLKEIKSILAGKK